MYISDGFVGCIQELVISHRYIDPTDIINMHMSVGVIVGSCDLQNGCETESSTCRHESLCVTEWGRSNCQCDAYHYGRMCQFGKQNKF